MNDIMNRSMVVYALTNTVNGKKYIGQTARPLEQRIKEHQNSKYLIGEAIRKYGWENFTVEILDECTTPAELDEREIYRIATLNTKVPNGYNITEGGEEQPHNNLKEVVCLDNGMIFPSIADAARWANVAYPAISNACNGKRLSAGGHRWAFLNDPVEPKTTDKRGKHSCRAVRCVETGEEFESIAAAARYYKIGNNRIAIACNNIEYSAANLHWQWADELPLDPKDVKPARPRGRRPVRCIETGVVYSSITEAAKAIGVSPSNIHANCKGECHTIKKLHFEFVDPESKISKDARKNTAVANRVPVICVETGVVYESMKAAGESIGMRGSYICAVVNGREKTAGGYHWRRLDDFEKHD